MTDKITHYRECYDILAGIEFYYYDENALDFVHFDTNDGNREFLKFIISGENEYNFKIPKELNKSIREILIGYRQNNRTYFSRVLFYDDDYIGNKYMYKRKRIDQDKVDFYVEWRFSVINNTYALPLFKYIFNMPLMNSGNIVVNKYVLNKLKNKQKELRKKIVDRYGWFAVLNLILHDYPCLEKYDKNAWLYKRIESAIKSNEFIPHGEYAAIAAMILSPYFVMDLLTEDIIIRYKKLRNQI